MSSRPATLGQLKESGWKSKSVKEEIRRNAVRRISSSEPLFASVIGFEQTVMRQARESGDQRRQEVTQESNDERNFQLDMLPPDLAGQVRELQQYDFASSEAREQFEQLMIVGRGVQLGMEHSAPLAGKSSCLVSPVQ